MGQSIREKWKKVKQMEDGRRRKERGLKCTGELESEVRVYRVEEGGLQCGEVL